MQELTRRSALSGLSIAVGAAVIGYVVSRNSAAATTPRVGTAANGYPAAAPSSTGRKRLADVSAVPEGGGIILASVDVVVTKTAGNTIHAFSGTCTHQGCPVTSVSGGTINCPCHGSRFDVRTGAVVAGPAPRPLPPVPVTVSGTVIFTP